MRKSLRSILMIVISASSCPAFGQVGGGIPKGTGLPIITLSNSTNAPVSFALNQTPFSLQAQLTQAFQGAPGASLINVEVVTIKKNGQRIARQYALQNGFRYSFDWAPDGVLDVFQVQPAGSPFGR
jgi:hypothetical protein